jgi:hypothetical protein
MPGNPMRRHPLAGQTVFLSTSEPLNDQVPKEAAVRGVFAREEEAILRVAAAVFDAGGTLLIGAHPSVSPLVGYLCAQYHLPEPAEGTRGREEQPRGQPAVVMYQSEFFSQSWAEPTAEVSRLSGIQVVKTQAAGVNGRGSDTPQREASLELMRNRMLQERRPAAMIAIGGREGVERELVLFQEYSPRRPIYALPSTGGGAARIAENERVRSFDQEVATLVREFRRREREQIEALRRERGEAMPRIEDREEIVALPYASIAGRIVEDIVRNLGRDEPEQERGMVR